MNIPTLKISDIVNKWKEALVSSEEINAFCMERYGRQPQIRIGVNKKRPPTESDCPVIVLRPGAKREGEYEETYTYVISVGWAIRNETEYVVGRTYEMQGTEEVDDLGQLILQEIQQISSNYPISTIDYELETIDFFPQFVGEMLLSVCITPLIGGYAISY